MSHSEQVTIGDRGRVVLPASIRNELKLKAGTRMLATTEEDGSVRLQPYRAIAARARGMFAEMWRKQQDREEIVATDAGVCLTIPLGTWFQFRSFGDEPLAFVVVTMPPWPASDEAYEVEGKWEPTVGKRA